MIAHSLFLFHQKEKQALSLQNTLALNPIHASIHWSPAPIRAESDILVLTHQLMRLLEKAMARGRSMLSGLVWTNRMNTVGGSFLSPLSMSIVSPTDLTHMLIGSRLFSSFHTISRHYSSNWPFPHPTYWKAYGANMLLWMLEWSAQTILMTHVYSYSQE